MSRRRSAIGRLAILSYGGHRFVLVLKAYCDESGHAQDLRESVVVVAGCIAPLEAWEKFEDDWKAFLDAYGVNELHMKHFAHSTGAFTGWKEHEEKRRAFLTTAADLMRRHVVAYVGAAIYLPDFRTLPEPVRARLGDPYFACFQVCAHDAAAQTLEDPAEKVEMVFARHPEFQGGALDFYYRLQAEMTLGERLGPISFADPKDVVQLQAADLVAFELRRFTAERIPLVPDPDPRSIRWPMGQILEHSVTRTFFHIFYREALETTTVTRSRDMTKEKELHDVDLVALHAAVKWLPGSTVMAIFDAIGPTVGAGDGSRPSLTESRPPTETAPR